MLRKAAPILEVAAGVILFGQSSFAGASADVADSMRPIAAAFATNPIERCQNISGSQLWFVDQNCKAAAEYAAGPYRVRSESHHETSGSLLIGAMGSEPITHRVERRFGFPRFISPNAETRSAELERQGKKLDRRLWDRVRPVARPPTTLLFEDAAA